MKPSMLSTLNRYSSRTTPRSDSTASASKAAAPAIWDRARNTRGALWGSSRRTSKSMCSTKCEMPACSSVSSTDPTLTSRRTARFLPGSSFWRR